MSDDLGLDLQREFNQVLTSARQRGLATGYDEIAEQLRTAERADPDPSELERMATGQLTDPDATDPSLLRALAEWGTLPDAFTSEIIRLKIKQLRQRTRKPTGEIYTLREIAEYIRELGYDGPSYSYLSQIVNGNRPRPGLAYLKAIADWAGVPMTYYFDDATAGGLNEQLEQLSQERAQLHEERAQQQHQQPPQDRARVMAMRASELSDKGFEQVSDILDMVHRIEHQNDTQDSSDS